MYPERAEFDAILELIGRHGVEYILVGGLAAILDGASVMTNDVDIVHSQTPDNVQRLLAALEDLDAHARPSGAIKKRPNATHLTVPGHLLLMTRFGKLDVRARIGNDESYDDLLPHSLEMDAGAGRPVRVLDLETLIRIKEATGLEVDRAALPLLRRTLDERKRRGI